MNEIVQDLKQSFRKLIGEINNFQDIVRYLKPEPGDLPELRGIDVYGESSPMNGVIGGDHVVYVDFKKRFDLEARIRGAERDGRRGVLENLRRCRQKAGIAVADVSGHQITDALLAAMLHQAFLLGAIYEMDHFGDITTRLFEHINTRFYRSSSVGKFLTMIYGEISEDGAFRFVSAAHPMPVVFSHRFDRMMDISQDSLTSFPPIGMLPSYDDVDRSASRSVLGFKQKYEINEITLMGAGDILLLYTDGLSDHCRGEEFYFPERLEATLRGVKDRSAREICAAIREDMWGFERPEDDVSFVVIKKT
jgi:serine phosphatase RsbU (regulator of sigma subunit)